jgi:hypothetical protein
MSVSATATAAPPATSGDDSGDDSSFNISGAGAESAGDSPKGKSGVVQWRHTPVAKTGGFYRNAGLSHTARAPHRR